MGDVYVGSGGRRKHRAVGASVRHTRSTLFRESSEPTESQISARIGADGNARSVFLRSAQHVAFGARGLSPRLDYGMVSAGHPSEARSIGEFSVFPQLRQ